MIISGLVSIEICFFMICIIILYYIITYYICRYMYNSHNWLRIIYKLKYLSYLSYLSIISFVVKYDPAYFAPI